MIPKFLQKEAIIARPGFNRWLVPPASIAIHLCIGSVYAWSIFNPALIRELGVVTSAAGDWSLESVVWIFSVAIASLGFSAALAGHWLERVGPRCVGVTAACLWGGGFIVGSVGIHLHQLWLIYLGYGVIGGCGLGLGYVSPVATLIRWFPDRRGLATGMAIMGFGGGAMIGAPLKEWLLKTFFEVPKFLGPVDSLSLKTEGGRRFAEIAGSWREIVIPTGSELALLPVSTPEGAYLVGSGNSGAASTFLFLGVAYFLVMIVASFSYRIPAEGWRPAHWEPPSGEKAKKKMMTSHNVDLDEALKTRQFYFLWIVLCFNVTAGIGVLGVAKTMMSEIFGTTLPLIVTGSFAATYVLMISVFNMLGRISWASASDYLGRKRTYQVFFILGMLLYLSIPLFATRVSSSPAAIWLVLFYAATMIIFTMYGGGFATIPAYLADIFGTKFVGGIHGRLLTAWSTAGILGPLAITRLRGLSADRAIKNLTDNIDPSEFEKAFGSPVANLDELVAAKTVTVAKLMEIAPPGVIDPTSSLYNTTMFAMAGLLAVALVANSFVRPVEPRHYLAEGKE